MVLPGLFKKMAKKSEVERQEQSSEPDPDDQKGREEVPITYKDVFKAIKHMKDRNGTTVQEIRKYLISTFDKFKNVPVKQLESNIKKAAIKGVQKGRITKKEGRFLMGKEPADASGPAAKSDDQSSSKRYRRRRGKCRVHRTNRPICSRYRKRCCRRRRRCRASRHRSKKSVCSRYRSGCCRRVRRR